MTLGAHICERLLPFSGRSRSQEVETKSKVYTTSTFFVTLHISLISSRDIMLAVYLILAKMAAKRPTVTTMDILRTPADIFRCFSQEVRLFPSVILDTKTGILGQTEMFS